MSLKNLRYLILLQLHPEIFSQLEVIPVMVTGAVSPNRPTDHTIDQIQTNQSMIAKTIFVTNTKQFRNIGNQFEIQTFSVISNPNTNKSEITGTIPPFEVTEILSPNSFILIQSFNLPLQVPTKTFRSDPVSQILIHIYLKYLYRNVIPWILVIMKNNFEFQNLATLSFLQFNRTQRGNHFHNQLFVFLSNFKRIQPSHINQVDKIIIRWYWTQSIAEASCGSFVFCWYFFIQ